MEKPLTIFYTANVRGQLDLLPRLHTFLRQLKAQPVDDESTVMLCAVEPVQRQFLLLDLGAACDDDVWHCAVTGGRSALIVMDAMGYQAANVSGYLTPEGRSRLDANLLQLVLVDAAQDWQTGPITVTGKSTLADQPPHLTICAVPGERTVLDGRVLRLRSVSTGQVGIVHINSADGNGTLTITGQTILDLPVQTMPDPTITATVDFVLSEARLFQNKRNS